MAAMRGDLPQAAFRLMQQLPVHTHTAPETPSMPGQHRSMYRDGSGGSNRRGLKIAGREYKSISAAMRDLKIAQRKIYRMIKDGTAVQI